MVSLTNPQDSTSTSTSTSIAVVMVPLPMQGHLNPLLHLSAHLSTLGISVHYISSTTHNRQAIQRLHGWNLSSSISSHLHFHNLPFSSSLPCFPSPSSSSTTKFPSHLQPSFDASTSHLLLHLSPILISLSLSHRRVVLLHDSSMSFANSAASPKTESFSFHTSSAISNLFFLGKSELCQENLVSCFGQEFLDWVWKQRRIGIPISVKGRIFNTCRSIEAEFLNQLSSEPEWKGQKIFAIGPLNPVMEGRGRSDDRCLKWLDRQPVASVLYVSFGTTATMTSEQEKEIAKGMEESGERFIWVRREADRCNIFEAEGKEEEEDALAELEERANGRIVVVRSWAPQLQILAHPSTGGFLSHCGWNSCMEAMSNGVPILAWPIHSDQPTNTVLVTKVLKMGMVVKEWSEKHEVVVAAAVKNAVVKLMVGDEGREVRKKAREIGESLRAAVVDGGSSKEDFDEFVNYICRP